MAESKIDDMGSFHPEICTDIKDDAVMGVTTDTYSYGGISVRMWLAGMAMQGMFSSEFGARIAAEMSNKKSIPEAAFMVADAMIATSKDNSDDQ